MRRRRFKRRLLWAAVLTGLALLAIPATARQAAGAVQRQLSRRNVMGKLIPAVVVLAVALVAGSSTFATASSVSAARSMSLIAVDVPKSEVYVDAGPKGEGPGDTLFFAEVLRRGERKVGRSEVMCVTVSEDVGRCSGTLRLADGTLEASGGVHFGGRFSLPVVGGTRAYAGASGVLTVIAVGDTRSRYAIELAE